MRAWRTDQHGRRLHFAQTRTVVRALPRLHDLRLAGCTGITPTGLAGLSSVAELRSVIVHGVLPSRDERRQLQATLAPTHVLHDPASYSDLQPLLDLAAEATLNQNDDVLVVAVGGEADSPIPYDAPPFGPGSPIPMNVPRRLAGRRSGAPASRVVNPDILSVLQDHPTIERLSIKDVPITDQHLGVLQRLPNLEMLHLIGVRVRGEGLAPLRESVNLRHVRIDSPSAIRRSSISVSPRLRT